MCYLLSTEAFKYKRYAGRLLCYNNCLNPANLLAGFFVFGVEGIRMHHYQYRSLLAAILLQAVKDYRSAKYRTEIKRFMESPEFEWMWLEITDDIIRMPRSSNVKSLILSNCVTVERGAYHNRRQIICGLER